MAEHHEWSRRRALRHGLVLAGLIVAVYMYVVVGDQSWSRIGTDSLAYWSADPADPYAGATVGGDNAYLYSPAFTQAFAVFRALPPYAFVVIWAALSIFVAVRLARPWPAALMALALPVSQEILMGNIHILLAGAMVAGFRYPATWSFVLLTKVTPGIGLLWFAVRREWRSLAAALGVTAAIVAASFLIAPEQWKEWFAVLGRNGGQESSRLLVRLALAAALVVWGAATGRGWTVPAAGLLALPVIWMDSLSMLLGCVALIGARQRVAGPARVGEQSRAADTPSTEAPSATPATTS
jgi:hypothetical protein